MRRTIRGGRRLGEGATGKVYNPVLACADGSDAPFRGPDYVGKAIAETSLDRELRHKAALSGMTDAAIAPLHHCALAEEQTNANFQKNMRNLVYEVGSTHAGKKKYLTYQVIYRYGGQNVAILLSDRRNHKVIFQAIKDFLPVLQEFNQRFHHFDLHLENLVFDGQRIRMIDFENMKPATSDAAHVDICRILFKIFHLLHRYSIENPNDHTYTEWLAANTTHSDFGRCIDSAYEEIVDAIQSIPTVDAPKPRRKCGSMGCAIMGGKRKSRRISRR